MEQTTVRVEGNYDPVLKRGRKRDRVWNHFDDSKSKKACCKYCSEVMVMRPERMRAHILEKCRKVKPNVRQDYQDEVNSHPKTEVVSGKIDTPVLYPKETQDPHETIKEYYGKLKKCSLKSNLRCTENKPSRYILEIIRKIPEEITSKYCGCGFPLPFGIEGLNVLDLGSGSGRDCYILLALVGAGGSVTGIDMTPEQLDISKKYVSGYVQSLGYSRTNIRFIEGYMELLGDAGISHQSMDIIVSNCVINLTRNKEQVLSSIYNTLTPGGEFYFSDIYCDRRKSETIRNDEALWGECLAGALYIEDFKQLCRQVGFLDPRQLSIHPVDINNSRISELVGETKFYSITFRCFKVPDLESSNEDYGQLVIYNGGIPQHKNSYRLDDQHLFETNLPVRVSGNTASIVGNSWLKKYFTVIGTRNTHYGRFQVPPTHYHPTFHSNCC